MTVAYRVAHNRVRSVRGRASDHTCDHCGGQAEHWAYDHSDPQPSVDGGLIFSNDISRYTPLCLPCHRRLDDSPEWLAIRRAMNVRIRHRRGAPADPLREIRMPDQMWADLATAAAEDATSRSALVRQGVAELLARRRKRAAGA